jgi:hypothetical protein
MKTRNEDSRTMDMDTEVMALARTAFQHARAGETSHLGLT